MNLKSLGKFSFRKRKTSSSLLFFGLLATFLARLEAARAASLAHYLGLPSPSLWLTSWSRAIYRWRGGPTRRRRLPHPAEAERDLFRVHSHARIFRGLWRACHTLAPIKAARRPCPGSLVRRHLCPSFAPLRAVWISLTSRRSRRRCWRPLLPCRLA